ncbi:hypothetical protein OIU76_025750 [Salix suchowensis]|nr:hypothetical protein OIU76_025750 [Salix suchowensis]
MVSFFLAVASLPLVNQEAKVKIWYRLFDALRALALSPWPLDRCLLGGLSIFVIVHVLNFNGVFALFKILYDKDYLNLERNRNFRQIIWSLSSDEFVEKHTCFPQTELHAYFLIQAPETKAIGDSLGFGSSFLFSSAFARNSIGSYPKIDPFWSSASFIYLCTVGVHLHLFTG